MLSSIATRGIPHSRSAPGSDRGRRGRARVRVSAWLRLLAVTGCFFAATVGHDHVVHAQPAPAADPSGIKAVYAQVAASIVLIQTEYGTGSGFFFQNNRLI